MDVTALCPAMMPPVGRDTTVKTPLARVTGISSLSGLMPTCALTLGLTSPDSVESKVARTASISTRPRFE